jgi:plastocyanin
VVKHKDGRPVAGCVVYLGELEVATTPKESRIVQKDKALHPRVTVVTTGSTVQFPNFDPVLHNIYSLSPTQTFDLGLYGTGESRGQKFDTPGLVEVYCSIHSQMNAVIIVTSNPYFTTTDQKGRFRINNVPPGAYPLHFWSESAGTQTRLLFVAASLTTDVDVVFSPPPKK